ncbi:MAG TPA: hypothetical protein VGO01_17845 [Bradyrhizobium sp.]|jgi:hypothetical protein|nr:hypothetical protein [Bradyrhizobium sp.]
MFLQLQPLAAGATMHIRFIAAAAAASLMTGCAIHPVPEDVTGADTSDIVKQIRCETRDAARRIIRERLERLATFGSNVTAQNLLAQFTADPNSMVGFNPEQSFPGKENKQIRNFFTAVYSTAIGYSFDLTMEEVNNISSTLNFLGPWKSVFTLGVTGSADRSRQNVRTFTITDKFDFLLGRLNTPKNGEQYCDGRIVGPNYVYPIAGQIGVYNSVRTFLQLAIFENLETKGDAAGDAPPLADKLTFITSLDFSATPKVVFTPVTPRFQLADAAVTGGLTRKDTHQVIVGLAMQPAGGVAVAALSGYVFSGAALSGPQVAFRRRGVGETLVLRRITATATSRAEQLALVVIDQLKSRELQLIAPPLQ